jgi:hypothetical protein
VRAELVVQLAPALLWKEDPSPGISTRRRVPGIVSASQCDHFT